MSRPERWYDGVNLKKFKEALREGSLDYLAGRDSRDKSARAVKAREHSSGCIHGKKGIIRAQNLCDALDGINQFDDAGKVALFAMYVAILESRSSWMVQCIAERMIRGKYHEDQVFDEVRSLVNTLESDVFANDLLKDSYTSGRKDTCLSYSRDGYGLTSSCDYNKDFAVRFLIRQVVGRLSQEDKQTFRNDVSMFEVRLAKEKRAQKPMDECGDEAIEMVSLPSR